MDFKPVICPYCGREMELDDRSFEGHGFWYSCDCGASSPFCKSEEEAYQYANPIEKPKWISVEERLPEDGQRVVGIAKNGMTGIMDYKADDTPFAARIFGKCFSEIIWWTPLPEPPEEK